MNLTGRPPIGLKDDRPRDNPRHLARVRSLPCCICEAFGLVQMSPTTAHHPIHGRYGNEKVPDREAIPLCWEHHLGPDGIHAGKETWAEKYGIDRNYIATTLDAIERANG